MSRTRSAVALADAVVPRLRPIGTAGERKRRLAELTDAAAEAGTDLAAFLDRPKVASFLASAMEASPFLRSLMLDDPARLAAILAADPTVHLKRVTTGAARAWKKTSETELMATLRRARQDVALTAALADLGSVMDMVAVTGALTAFADAAVGAATNFLLAEAAAEGKIDLPDAADPAKSSGWIVLGMGKFGAGELNYSSDIDLIVLFDAEVARLPEDDDPQALFVGLTKRLVAILQDRTANSYVFRTDLRLRPDPGATAIAMSSEAALLYYESFGQNWERAALIKARPVAGDVDAGARFLAELTPYIWRKYLDYAAIADIHSIKRQIHDHRGHGEVAVAGHNIKLGRGGIREIEFFVQTQQLVAGGRHPELRGRRTLDMLAALAAGGWIDAATRDDLSRAYVGLRRVEHCLQMINDEQTHTLPNDDEGLAIVAKMTGFRDRAAFGAALTKTFGAISERYSGLFEHAAPLTSAVGSLVFTGDADDPDTFATLTSLGFHRPADVTRAVREWHFGRYPATRSASARERLTEFVPLLIETLGSTENADAAFVAFDRFLSRMPAGVQLFSLLQSNPRLLRLLITILAVAPRLAETVVGRAHVLDALIEPEFFDRLPDRATLDGHLATTLTLARGYEDVLDRARIFGQEQAFLIGVRLLAGTVTPRQAGHAYSDLAEALVVAMLAAVRREFEAAHGKLRGAEVAVLAMGRLGGREMTATSDLDLILLYDFDERATASSSKRSLPPLQYFARLTQRLLAAISAPTAEGMLYAVDFRLRPSGKSGPLATHIDAFATYQAKEAWTWEHMALTRARPIAGDARIVKRAADVIAKLIRTPHDRKKVLADVAEMRAMVEEAKGGEGAWDLKQAPGGLVDIEFIAQALELIHAAKHAEIASTDTEAVLTAAAKAKVLPRAEADVLLPALRLYQSLFEVLRLAMEGGFEPAEAPRGLLERLAEAGELPDFATLDAHLKETQAAVRASFERVIGKVAATER